MKKTWWIVLAVVVAAAAVVIGTQLASAPEDAAAVEEVRAAAGGSADGEEGAPPPHADNPMVQAILARPWETAANLTDEERSLIDRLVRELEGRLWHAAAQLDLLEDLVGWLKERYPDSWRQELERILRAAFPGMADQLLRLWDGREGYAEWQREHRRELMRLPRAERSQRIWEARQEHYGVAANEIFEAARRSEAIAQALERIDAEPSAAVEERFDEYMSAIEEQFGDRTDEMLEQRRQEVMDRFLSLSSVQDELARLEAQERYERLRALREAAGMDQQALERWTALDRRRDERWQEGQGYVEAREELLARYEGEDLEQRLQQLREEHFGEEADTVRHEEESGFFRFERERVYGQN